MKQLKKDHAACMNADLSAEASETSCVKARQNKLIIELRVYNQNPIEFFLQLHYQIMHLLNNQDDESRIKCLNVIKFLDQTTPINLEELAAICEQAKQAG